MSLWVGGRVEVVADAVDVDVDAEVLVAMRATDGVFEFPPQPATIRATVANPSRASPIPRPGIRRQPIRSGKQRTLKQI